MARLIRLGAALACAIGLGASGPDVSASDHIDRVPAQAAEVVVSLEWLDAHLADPLVTVLATGGEASYRAGHIPGAGFIGHAATLGADHGMAAPDALRAALTAAGVTDSSRIVIYGDEPLSIGWLYAAIASIGHGDRVVLLDGNAVVWRESGRALTTEVRPTAGASLTVRRVGDVMVDAPWVRDRLESSSVRILDVRTRREWDAGRLPGATLVLWQDFYADVERTRLKSRADIRRVFAAAGVRPGDQVVTYCAVGMRASLAYALARYAGFDARVYLGSWQDWARRAGYPIIR